MGHGVKLRDVRNYLSGKYRYLLSRTGALEPHITEQVEWRIHECKDTCAKKGKCKMCGCKYPDRAFSHNSCNKLLFPDLLDKESWKRYKDNNNIE